MNKLFSLSLMAISFISFAAEANFYIRPRAGAVVGVNNGNSAYSVGLTAGYRWNKLIATEAAYTHLWGINDGIDGDTYRASAIVSSPIGIIAPYASIGAGLITYNLPFENQNEFFVPIGAGITLLKVVGVSATVGAEYLIVNNGEDLFEPFVSLGLGF